MSLADIRRRLENCTRCPLHESRTHLVFGEGDPDADILLIGEAPGAREDAEGRPFVGASGKLLDQMLDRIGLSRGDVFIANVLKCRPPSNRNPRPEEIETCVPFLFEQIEAIQPRIVGTLGNFSSRLLLGTREGITKLRGEVHERQGVRIFPMYHPAAALHNGALRGEIERDFDGLRALADPDRSRDSSAD